METVIPLILVGLGCATLVIARGGWLVLGGLVVQWAGLIITSILLGVASNPGVHIAEAVTALACGAVLALTLLGLGASNRGGLSSRRRARYEQHGAQPTQEGTVDDLWPLVVVLAAAIAGLVLARLYPLGGAEGTMIAFYWSALAGVLVLVLDGAREPVKLAAGLLALLNAVALLLNALPGGAPEPVAIGLMAVGRVALALTLAYSWTLLHALFSDLTLAPLFESRGPDTSTDAVENAEQAVGEGSEVQGLPSNEVKSSRFALERSEGFQDNSGQAGEEAARPTEVEEGSTGSWRSNLQVSLQDEATK